MRRIETKEGLQTFINRLYKAASEGRISTKEDTEWTGVALGCMMDDLAIDETDWENMSPRVRSLTMGLR